MSNASRDKAGTPHEDVETAAGIVADTRLSQHEKSEALGTLEQDARQLSVASNEGMIGGEASQLQKVMNAQEALDLTPTQQAYALVLQDLRTQQAASPRDGMQSLVDHAVEILEAIQRATATVPSNPEDSRPGFKAEAAMETALERLDP